TQRVQNFQHFAPGREGPTVVALVVIHGAHEDNLFFRVIPLTRGRIDLPTTFASITAFLGRTAFPGDRLIVCTPWVLAPLGIAAVGNTQVTPLGGLRSLHDFTCPP